jgi:hypothetical protein
MNSVLIPASGSAVRMRGLPKFLLPSGVMELSILELHIRQVANYADEILIGVNPKFFEIVVGAKLNLHGAQIIPLETKSMTETVIGLVSLSSGTRFTVVMPDTVFESDESYNFANLKSDLDLSLWRIRSDQYGKLGQVSISPEGKVLDCVDKNPDCKYEFSWGAMTFSRKFLDHLDIDFPHVGYGIVPALRAKLSVNGVILPGRYWDCGTPTEYIRYLKTVEI